MNRTTNNGDFLFLMGLILAFAVLASIFESFSSEDTEKLCDCNITTSKYIESMQTYEPISTEHYSDNCEDHKPFYNPDGKGNYYMIQCK